MTKPGYRRPGILHQRFVRQKCLPHPNEVASEIRIWNTIFPNEQHKWPETLQKAIRLYRNLNDFELQSAVDDLQLPSDN